MSFTFLGSSLLRPCKCIQRLDLPDSLAQCCKRSIYSNNLIESLFRSDIVNIDLCSFFQVLSIARYSSLPCLSIRCPRKTPSCRDYCLVQPYNSIRIKGQGKMLPPPPFSASTSTTGDWILRRCSSCDRVNHSIWHASFAPLCWQMFLRPFSCPFLALAFPPLPDPRRRS